jgi:hypothetical protein
MEVHDGRLPPRGRRLGRAARLLGPLAVIALAVAGCSQGIAAWRSLRGLDADDPNPKTAPFTGNMAKAYEESYPNLASVPPPPTEETSTAERRALAQTLIAERNATAALGGAPSPAAAPGKPPAVTSIATAATPRSPAAKSAAAAAPASPPPATVAALIPAKPAAAPPRAAGVEAHRPGPAPALQPLNSTLRMPVIPAPLPQPQTPQPPPNAPVLPAVAPVPTASTAPPAAAATAMPQPPPPPPALPAIAALPAPMRMPPERPPAVTVATLDLAAASAADRAQIAHVAALYRQQPRGVRVVAFAAAPPPGSDPLKLYNTALDRAQKVAKALVAAGIPARQIKTEAGPASRRQAGRVEIQFAP